MPPHSAHKGLPAAIWAARLSRVVRLPAMRWACSSGYLPGKYLALPAVQALRSEGLLYSYLEFAPSLFLWLQRRCWERMALMVQIERLLAA